MNKNGTDKSVPYKVGYFSTNLLKHFRRGGSRTARGTFMNVPYNDMLFATFVILQNDKCIYKTFLNNKPLVKGFVVFSLLIYEVTMQAASFPVSVVKRKS